MKSEEFVKSLVISVTIGVLAFVLNMFRLPLFFEAEFVFGPCLVILVAIFRGPVAGFVCSTIASYSLVMAWGSYWATLTFGLEAIFVGIICQYKRMNVILVVICFWVAIGMPVSWYSISQYELFLDSHRTAILIKQLTNAIVYAHLAALLMYLPWVKKLLSQSNENQALSIKEQSSHIISSLLITAGILFFFFNLNQNIKNSGERYNGAHDFKHEKLKSQLSLMFTNKIDSMQEFKYTLAEVWSNPQARQKALLEYNKRHPSFKTMIITDSEAKILHSSPAELMKNINSQNEIDDVSDRDYFQKAINSSETYVSPAFIGRGFGNHLIAAISVGIPSTDFSLNNLGVLEGSFILTSLNEVKTILNNIDPSVDAVLLDQKDQVLMASEQLNLIPLELLKFSKGVDTFYQHDLVSIKHENGGLGKEVYYFGESEFEWGWKLITLQNEAKFADVIENILIIFAVSIVLVVLVSKILAYVIAHSWSYHMRRLNQLIERGDEFDRQYAEFEENDQLPEEIRNLYQEIKQSRLVIIKMNHELQNTVAKRTESLQKVNTKLNIMAREDALTKLNNRRVFNERLNEIWVECQAELKPMSMLVIDIDFFKNVNDSFGHPVGDEVLVQLAEQLSDFDGDNVKCIARLGGEEFCLLLKGSEHHKVIDLAEKIRKHIEDFEFHVGSDKTIHITISIGVASINTTKFTSSKLYQLADHALYQSKHSGRNQVNDYNLDE